MINPFPFIFAEHYIQSFAYNNNIVQIKADYKQNAGEIRKNYGGRSKPSFLKRNTFQFIKKTVILHKNYGYKKNIIYFMQIFVGCMQ